MKKTYFGKRTQQAGPEAVSIRMPVGSHTMVTPLKHYNLHSPDGFQWGYGGSGPADLALAILLDHLGQAPSPKQLREGKASAVAVYQEFKWKFVSAFGDEWELSSDQIQEWLDSPEIAAKLKVFEEFWGSLSEQASG